MARTYEYKSLVREHTPGTAYESTDELLNIEGSVGWQLVSVAIAKAWYRDVDLEIFYLMRDNTS